MSRARRPLIGAAALAACGATLAACTGGLTAATFSVTPTTAVGVTLSTERSPAGRVLATASGHTLYDFTPDTARSSACTTTLCRRLWPPLVVTGTPSVGKGLHEKLVGTIRRAGGQRQVTYGGHPLYTWAGDGEPGMITGQAILNVGGYWYVVSPSGEQITTPFRVARSAVHR